jgi:hypothetical protein
MPRSRSRKRRKSPVRIILQACLLILGTLAGVALAEPADGDMQASLVARNALWDDPTLGKLNLGVSVRKGIAVLSGPVPSRAVADQAIERLRAIAGIRQVVNDTYIPSSDEPLAKSMPHPITAQRPSVSVAPAVASPEPIAPPPRVVAAPPLPPTPKFAPAAAVPVKAMSLRDEIEARRLWDRRFQNVHIDLRDGTVVLTGTVTRSSDAWEFATALRQLPGVTGVVQRTTTAP